MLKSVKDGWVAKLRSGDWKQGTCRLRVDDQYCCMGVLLEQENLLISHFVGEVHGDPYHIYYDKAGSPAMNIGYPSKLSAEQLGLNEATMIHLARLNDVEGKTFDEIADYIDLVL